MTSEFLKSVIWLFKYLCTLIRHVYVCLTAISIRSPAVLAIHSRQRN